ncbi:hypothetical protein BLNAU_4866 [Blattamonas nauphoetae]|uniref:Right handed beta helix domain-containing protein n=1 Tax=Blattamonas nauphoetae TaxID=2049346 RepID=A0ABQ9Y973_9EUKA|nr:hypothetical protein BLNAU_4866 [Blattamonas nauphoetae]
MLTLKEEVILSSAIQIRSDDLSLIGNRTRLLFHHDLQHNSEHFSRSPIQASTKNEQKQTPKVGSDKHSITSFITDHLAPFVDIAIRRTDTATEPAECLTIVGSGLWFDSKALVGGTGPLFSFSLSEQAYSIAASKHALRMETTLLRSTLLNMTCRSPFSPNTQLFGTEVCQRVVGSCVEKSTNHDCGTGMMSANLGGNVMCLNTSFSSCVREHNTMEDFKNTNYTQGDRLNNVPAGTTSVTFTLCTFNEMTVASGEGSGGAALFLHQTLSSLTITVCSFHTCSATADNSSFTQCSTSHVAGSVFVQGASTATIDNCFFELSSANNDGATSEHVPLMAIPTQKTFTSHFLLNLSHQTWSHYRRSTTRDILKPETF